MLKDSKLISKILNLEISLEDSIKYCKKEIFSRKCFSCNSFFEIKSIKSKQRMSQIFCSNKCENKSKWNFRGYPKVNLPVYKLNEEKQWIQIR